MTTTTFARPGFHPAGRAFGVDVLTRRAFDRLLAVLMVGALLQFWLRDLAPIAPLEAVLRRSWELGALGIAVVCGVLAGVLALVALLAGTRLGPFGAVAAVVAPLMWFGAPGDLAVATVFAVVAGAAVTVTLLGHEAAHVHTARWFGMRAEGVVLTGFGAGAVITDDDFPSPRAAMAVTAAGPAVNLLAASAAWLLAGVLTPVFPVAGAAAELVAGINLAAAFLNLLPVPPLDGGWVFTGALWALRPEGGQEAAAKRAGRWGWVLLVAAAGALAAGAAVTGSGPLTAGAVLAVATAPTIVFTRWRVAAVQRSATLPHQQPSPVPARS
jgi:Zn-dependent protease